MRKSLTFGLLLIIAPACSSAGTEDAPLAARGDELTKCGGGTNLQYDYCDDPACPCDDGEGDCADDSQCTASPGLVCGVDNGLRYGGYWETNVCWPATCENGALDPGEVTIDNGGPCGCELKDYYEDADQDGWGKIMAPNRYCTPPATSHWVTQTGDCAETNPNVNPGVAEVCFDGIDNNCNGQQDEGCTTPIWCLDGDGDGYPRSTSCQARTTRPAYNWIQTNGSTQYDCNDASPPINPGATELCGDNLDSDCDGNKDNGCTTTTWCLDGDGDGYPRSTMCQSAVKQPAYNWLATSGTTDYDCNDSKPSVNPGATEVCNGIDDNCNGQTDETDQLVWYLDNDGDGFPRSTGSIQSCTKPAYNWMLSIGAFDCNDSSSAINPNAAEVCGDSIDNDCDGQIDIGCTPSTCTNGSQDGNETGVDCGGFCDVCSTGGTPTSCVGLAKTCGTSGSQDCCASSTVFGADYYRSYDGTSEYPSQANPATVYSYRLDRFEVTVGRFRQFVNAFDTWRGAGNPADGAGAHPLIPGTGWDSTQVLAASAGDLITNLKCGDANYRTWTDTAGANEPKPINCVSWMEAAAFCLWDNGRLPTDAEWNLAAAGGDQQRAYPWSVPSTDTTLTSSNATYGCVFDSDPACSIADIAEVGTLTGGVGRYLQADLAGNMWEWNWDWYESAYPNPCVNCANTAPAVKQFRVVRGGSWQSLPGTNSNLRVGRRSITTPTQRDVNVGFRCARGN